MVLGPMCKGISRYLSGTRPLPISAQLWVVLLRKGDEPFRGGHCVFYYWDKTDQMIFGVFGEAIDKFDVRVEGNRFALEIEAQPFTGHFRREWCP